MHPEIGRQYILVRLVNADVACVRYERFSDGSAMAVANGAYAKLKGLDETRYAAGTVLNADDSDTAWLALWTDLTSAGFIDAADAKQAGLLPTDWQPPTTAPGLRW